MSRGPWNLKRKHIPGWEYNCKSAVWTNIRIQVLNFEDSLHYLGTKSDSTCTVNLGD